MRRVFLTGASSGIGLAIAQELVRRGDEVWGTSRNPERVPEVPRLHPMRLDLGDPRSVEEAFNVALAEAGHLDVLINNAGTGHFGPAGNLSQTENPNQIQNLGFRQGAFMPAAFPPIERTGK